MNKSISLFFIIIFMFSFSHCSQNKDTKSFKSSFVLLNTTLGNIKLKLYDETPQHRDNFLSLVNKGYYNGVLFHRVIKYFMIQSGDPESKTSKKNQLLGNGGPGYTIPAEFRPGLFHKRGALAAAREGDRVNPLKSSSGSQFYIVQGRKYTNQELNSIEDNINDMNKNAIYYLFLHNLSKKAEVSGNQNDPSLLQEKAIEQTKDSLQHYMPYHFTEKQREIYKTIGGAPHLDGNYTVFGEVVSGMDVVDKIAMSPTDSNDRPLEDVRIISAKVIRK